MLLISVSRHGQIRSWLHVAAVSIAKSVTVEHSIASQQQVTVTSNLAFSNKHLIDTNNLHYAPSKALVAGSASSLPSLVLRSMLKQRCILMRMH